MYERGRGPKRPAPPAERSTGPEDKKPFRDKTGGGGGKVSTTLTPIGSLAPPGLAEAGTGPSQLYCGSSCWLHEHICPQLGEPTQPLPVSHGEQQELPLTAGTTLTRSLLCISQHGKK